MTTASRWRREFLGRFSDREDLGSEGVWTAFWQDLPRESVFELFSLIELEFGLGCGLLRPTDPLSKFSDPLKTWNPLAFPLLEGRRQDAFLEIGYQLGQRLDRFGTREGWSGIRTVDHFVRAWCGMPRPEGPAETTADKGIGDSCQTA